MNEILFFSVIVFFIGLSIRETQKASILQFKCAYYEEKLLNRGVDISHVKNAKSLKELIEL